MSIFSIVNPEEGITPDHAAAVFEQTTLVRDASMEEIGQVFIFRARVSNGIDFMTDVQLQQIYAIVNNEINRREIGLIPY